MGSSPAVAVVRAAAAAFNRGDVDGYLRYFDPAGSRWVVGFETPLTLLEIRDNVVQMLAGFDELELGEEALFGQGDSVCARWRLRGVHVGEFLGVAAGGRTVDVRTCEVYELQDGLVRDVWTYGDHLELFRQLGSPAPEGSAP